MGIGFNPKEPTPEAAASEVLNDIEAELGEARDRLEKVYERMIFELSSEERKRCLAWARSGMGVKAIIAGIEERCQYPGDTEHSDYDDEGRRVGRGAGGTT